MSHRRSNEGDLKLKYDYLYTLAHKVAAESKMIMVKRKFDPDRTNTSYLQEHHFKNGQEYIIDSDSSSDEVDSEVESVDSEITSDVDSVDSEVFDNVAKVD